MASYTDENGKTVELTEEQEIQAIALSNKQYCPFCVRDILPSNVDDVYHGLVDGFVFVHDADAIHDEDYNYEAMH